MDSAAYANLVFGDVLRDIRREIGGNLDAVIWTQDGAACHRSKQVRICTWFTQINQINNLTLKGHFTNFELVCTDRYARAYRGGGVKRGNNPLNHSRGAGYSPPP